MLSRLFTMVFTALPVLSGGCLSSRPFAGRDDAPRRRSNEYEQVVYVREQPAPAPQLAPATPTAAAVPITPKMLPESLPMPTAPASSAPAMAAAPARTAATLDDVCSRLDRMLEAMGRLLGVEPMKKVE